MSVSTIGLCCAPGASMREPNAAMAGFVQAAAGRSALAAQQEHRLLAKQIPEPPWRIEPQRRAPRIKGDGFFHLHPRHLTEIAEIFDGAEVDIGRVVPCVWQIVGYRHRAVEQKLQPD